MKVRPAFAAMLLLAACTATPGADPVPSRAAPLIDYHQHLVSPAFAPIVKLAERDGAALVRALDAAGIERAVVLSVGYSFADERKKLSDPDRLTREENDWTSAEVVRHAPRLVGFCSANPLRPVALQELERCLGLPGMKGIKLHLGNSGVSLRDPAHLARIRQLFALAQRLRAPVLVHMRARGGTNYGAEDAGIFLDQVVRMAPDVEIVVAHFGGAGPGFPPQADEVMAVFAAAAERGDPRMAGVYFDVATIVTEDTTSAAAALVAQRIREVGPGRVLYGSDLNPPGGGIRQGWEIFRTKVPLTAAELEQIANNLTRFTCQEGSGRRATCCGPFRWPAQTADDQCRGRSAVELTPMGRGESHHRAKTSGRDAPRQPGWRSARTSERPTSTIAYYQKPSASGGETTSISTPRQASMASRRSTSRVSATA